jgi:hypothetical protein
LGVLRLGLRFACRWTSGCGCPTTLPMISNLEHCKARQASTDVVASHSSTADRCKAASTHPRAGRCHSCGHRKPRWWRCPCSGERRLGMRAAPTSGLLSAVVAGGGWCLQGGGALAGADAAAGRPTSPGAPLAPWRGPLEPPAPPCAPPRPS